MKVLILAGGLGTGLAEVTSARPKPMVEIGGKPILWHIMNLYARHGFKDFLIACGYKGEMIKEYFRNYAVHNSDLFLNLKDGTCQVANSLVPDREVGLVDTGLNTLTGGRLRRLQSLLGSRFATNVMGTVHVLEAVRQTPSVRAVVVVTSDKCYENREWFWEYREEDALGGYDPYSSSKACAELLTAAYRQSFFSHEGTAAVATARAGNVIGGGDWSEDRLAPDIVRGIASNQPINIRRPNSVRPWQHVLEPVRGYLLLAERLWDSREYAEPWNFGPREQDAVPVADVAQRLISAWGKGELRIQPDPDAPHEAQYLRLNASKARTRSGWEPQLALEQALHGTSDWYQAYYNDAASAAAKTAEQIQRYSETMPHD
jgi:CDP-glucose 4,6-dehydratase